MTRRDRLVSAIAAAAIVLVLALRATGALNGPRLGMVDVLDPGIAASDELVVVTVEGPALAELVDPDGSRGWRAPDGSLTARADAAIVRTLVDLGATAIAFADVRATIGITDQARDEQERATDALRDATRLGVPVIIPRVQAAPVQQRGRITPVLAGDAIAPAQLQTHNILVPVDDSSVVRAMPIRLQVRGESYLATPVALVLATIGVDRGVVDRATFEEDGLRVGRQLIQDRLGDGNLHLRWSDDFVAEVPGTTFDPDLIGTSGDHHVSAMELLAGRIERDRIAGRPVLVGSIWPLSTRYEVVPGGPLGGIPTVWAQANAVNTLLADASLTVVPPSVDTGLVIALGFLGAGLVGRGRLRRGAIALALAVPAWLLVQRLLLSAGRLADPLHPLLAMLLAGLGGLVLRYLTEARRSRRVASLFASYVPPEVAEALVEEDDLERHLAGERLDVTVFFCDLRGFTATAATLEPSQVRDLLNIYYRHVAKALLDHGATVMQYVGDEVFAVFGAPMAGTDSAGDALRAAWAAQGAKADITAALAEHGLPPIQYGIGLNAGLVVAAHVGDDDTRRQYSVIGDTVNVGARLCSRAAADEVVLSGEVRDRAEAVGDVQLGLELLDHAPMKGVDRPVEVLRLTSLAEMA